MILALETASTDTSVALAAADGSLIALDARSGDHRQNGTLLPRILDVLGGRRFGELTRVAVGIGPMLFRPLRPARSERSMPHRRAVDRSS